MRSFTAIVDRLWELVKVVPGIEGEARRDERREKKAIVLLSGGLDSATCLAIAKQQGFAMYAMSFRYGQRHTQELELARYQASTQGVVEHIVIDIDLRPFKGSALTDSQLEVPKHHSVDEITTSIPITYVPARNTIFLSFALGWAESLGAKHIFIGVNALDYSGLSRLPARIHRRLPGDGRT